MPFLQKIFNYLLDILFPIECLGCQQPDTWLCDKCLEKIPLTPKPSCPICHTYGPAAVCKTCRDKTNLDGLLIAASYENPQVQQAIHLLKYNYIQAMATPLSKLLVTYAVSFDKKFKPAILQNLNNTVIAPIPLHKKRLLERGFNQSDLLGRLVSGHFNIKYFPDLIYRNRYTQAQAKLSKSEREQNLTGAFIVSQNFDILNKNVIIIDDVATTLTTLNECAKVLKQAGCKEVWGLVIARGS